MLRVSFCDPLNVRRPSSVFSETTGQFILIFGRNSLYVTLLLISKIHDDISKNMAETESDGPVVNYLDC